MDHHLIIYGTNISGGVSPWESQADNEPNNSNGNEDCVEMYKTLGTWNDVRCNDTNEALCNYPEAKVLVNDTNDRTPKTGEL